MEKEFSKEGKEAIREIAKKEFETSIDNKIIELGIWRRFERLDKEIKKLRKKLRTQGGSD